MVHPLLNTSRWLRSLGLISESDLAFTSSLVTHECPFVEEFRSPAAFHLHVRIHDTTALPTEVRAEAILDRPGFLIIRDRRGVHVSFSSIPVVAGNEDRPRPHLDHVGLDFKDESDLLALRAKAAAAGWPATQQGGKGKPVSCCYATVAAKLWVFPPHADVAIEFAFGDESETTEMGDDLRPAKSQCCPGSGSGA